MSTSTKEIIKVKTDQIFYWSDKEFISLLEEVCALYNKLPLEALRYIRQSDESHQYYFRATDGRIWSQNIQNANDPDPLMNFSTSFNWRGSEFAFQQPIRERFFMLNIKYGIEEMIFTWDTY